MSIRVAQGRSPAGPAIGFGVVGIAALLVLIIAIFGSFTQVGVGEVGIVKHFGAIDTDHPDVFDPGIHTKVPFRDDVVIFDTRIQKEQVDSSAASKDGVTIHSTITINFHIEAAKAPLILQNIGANYKERIIDQQIQQAFKDVTAQYAGLELIQKREEVALKAKSVLRTEAETALIVAQGLANAQKAQATTLTPEYLQLQAINKWNGQLPQYLTPNTPLPFIGTTPTTPAR